MTKRKIKTRSKKKPAPVTKKDLRPLNLQPFKLIISILLCNLAGAIGSVFSFSSIPTWYATLDKPAFSPPNWIFGPVWTALYIMMGVALYLVWIKGTSGRLAKTALTVFGIQLVLNSIWSILFFGLQNPLFAFVEIIFLWIAVYLTIFFFHKISRPAAYLLVPYLLWISFASVLNYYIFLLN